MQIFTSTFTPTLLADSYGSGSYDSATYSPSSYTGSTGSGSTATTTPSTSSTAAASTSMPPTSYLADTGTAIVIFITFASVIIFAAIAVRVWRKPSSKQS